MIENIDNEIWKDISGYEGLYMISDLGKIKSCSKFKGTNYNQFISEQLKSQRSDGNYLQVSLSKNGIKKTFRVHVLVAKHFVPNPDNLSEINHNDGNKLNCKASNLEWCNRLQNEQHAWNTGLKNRFTNNRSRALIQYDKKMNLISEYENSQIAQEKTGYNRSVIGRAARGDIYYAYGFIWKFKEN